MANPFIEDPKRCEDCNEPIDRRVNRCRGCHRAYVKRRRKEVAKDV